MVKLVRQNVKHPQKGLYSVIYLERVLEMRCLRRWRLIHYRRCDCGGLLMLCWLSTLCLSGELGPGLSSDLRGWVAALRLTSEPQFLPLWNESDRAEGPKTSFRLTARNPPSVRHPFKGFGVSNPAWCWYIVKKTKQTDPHVVFPRHTHILPACLFFQLPPLSPPLPGSLPLALLCLWSDTASPALS